MQWMLPISDIIVVTAQQVRHTMVNAQVIIRINGDLMIIVQFDQRTMFIKAVLYIIMTLLITTGQSIFLSLIVVMGIILEV